MSSQTCVWGVICLFALGQSTLAAETGFQQGIGRLFSERCLRCHDRDEAAGGLVMETRESTVQGGDSGAAVVPGDAAASLLWEQIIGEDPAMPDGGPALTDEQRSVIRTWIDAGAPWPEKIILRESAPSRRDWWSLQPLVQPAIPESESRDPWVRTPVDAFILHQLAQRALRPSAPASRSTLIRRVYFDLIGLPPEPDEVRRFVNDPNPLAYERLVDRLMASPRYGERWARHWLDVVHYGDTHGYDKDKPRPNAWPYRDYVIRSMNEDKPYERFVRQQLAGDRLWRDDPDAIVATGFIAAGPWDLIGHAEVPATKIDGQVARNLDRDDMVTSTMATFTSTTVHCARCHNHKFDPITQEHYYSLQAIFAALDRADRKYDTSPVVARKRRKLEQQRDDLRHQRDSLQESLQESPAQESSTLANTPVSTESREPAGGARIDGELKEIEQQLHQLPAQKVVYAGTVHHGSGAFRGTGPEGGRPRDIFVLNRGDVTSRGPSVGPGVPPLIDGLDWHFDLPIGQDESDRRVALAEWLVRRDHPLTWRSIVNRIWLYHFGRGLVQTPNDFGRMGQLPTHPQLLDWLAVYFRDQGQSFKSLHRLIVTSSVYRQVSSDRGGPSKLDADNALLWRMNRRVLDAEAIRDTILQMSGQMDFQMYGPGFRDFVIKHPEHSPHYEYHLHDPSDRTTHRRAVYRFLVRSQQQPFMQTLDCADPSESVPQRDTTLTAIQALTLMNNRFVTLMSDQFARRLDCENNSLQKQVDQAVWLALNREATNEEQTWLVDYARQHGLANFCRLLVNLNEFVFID